MDIQLGDVLTMKKPHPCGDKRFWCFVPERIFASAVLVVAMK